MLWTVKFSSLLCTFVHLLSSKPKEKLRSVSKQICTKLQKGYRFVVRSGQCEGGFGVFVIIVALCFHHPLLYMKFLFDIHVPLLLFTIYRGQYMVE